MYLYYGPKIIKKIQLPKLDYFINAFGIISATVEATSIEVSFKTNLLIPKVNESDEVVLIAKTLLGELLVSKKVRGTDALGVISIAHPGILAADVKCCYLFVLNANGSRASRSVYIPLN